MGYLCFFGFFLIVGLVLILFPKQMKNKHTIKRQKSIKMGHLPGEQQVNFSFKGYLRSMVSLCKNKVFMLAVLGITVKMLYTIGLFTFLIKILILKFGVQASTAGKTLGIIMAPSLVGK